MRRQAPKSAKRPASPTREKKAGPAARASETSRARDKPYHHGRLRAELVRAAQEMIETGGVEALSVREVARRAGVSPTAPFRHFPDKRSLVCAVATDAMRSFVEFSEQAAAAAGGTATQRYRALGIAYVDFAIAHPSRFRAMCDPELRSIETDELRELRARYAAVLENRVADVVRASGRAEDREPARLAGHALAYGLAHMIIDGMIPGPRARARAAAIAALDVLGVGIGASRAPA